MKLYAEAPSFRARQAVRDALGVLWILLWVWIGMGVHDLVNKLAGGARSIERAGNSFARPFDDARERVTEVPVVGDALASPFEAAAGAGRVLAGAGAAQQDVIHTLALWLGVLFAVLPVALLLALYLPARLRWVREASAAVDLRAGGAGLELFALRAVATRPLGELRRAVPDAAAAWSSGDHAALASLELRRLGLRAVPRPSGP